jgi:hypothetical protein
MELEECSFPLKKTKDECFLDIISEHPPMMTSTLGWPLPTSITATACLATSKFNMDHCNFPLDPMEHRHT